MLKIISITLLAPLAFISKKNWVFLIIILAFTSTLSLTLISPAFSISHYLLNINTINYPLIPLTLWIIMLMFMASIKIFMNNHSPKLFMLMLMFLNLSLITTFSTNNMIMFYILFETTLIPTLILILTWGYQPERIQASNYLMLYTVTASLPLLISMLIISYKMNSSSFILFNWSNTTPTNMKFLWWVTMSFAFLVKMPMFMSHLWLPKAHVEAPVAGSMILAAILLKLGSYGLIRMYTLLPFMSKFTSYILLPISMWGAVITSMICIRQPDMKALIAYSSVSHMAILIMGLSMNSSWGMSGSMIMMIAHGLTSSLLFALANILYQMLNSRMTYMMKGCLTISPMISMIWFITLASNMSAPPSINLISEIILISSFMSKFIILIPIMSIIIFLSLLYSMNLFSMINHGHPTLFNNPSIMLTELNMLMSSLHLIPSFFLILSLSNLLI